MIPSPATQGLVKWMTYLLATLTVIACGFGLWHNDIYQDGPWANAQWLGQDAVTLVLATPLLLWSFHRMKGPSAWKWALVFAGVLFYFVYSYAFYLFAAKLTWLYLLQVPIFSLALMTLSVMLGHIFSDDHPLRGPTSRQRGLIAAYLLLIAAMVAGLWLADIAGHLWVPGHRSDTPDGSAPLIIYSLDLAVVIPLMVASAIGLLRRQGWGWRLTGLMLVKTSTLGYSLMAMALSMYLQALHPDTFLIGLWSVIGMIGTGLTIWFLALLRPA
ncbi:MAG: hypothetical protein KDC54_13130 [Lewinella sp.]|nr:hypothetical protein [Lewinella sp.]